MSKIEVNTVEPQCGTTLTLGGSGDTVTLGAGASQSGFKAVDWQTSSIKTATFTAVAGKGYFCNTSGGAFNFTLPSSPTAGDTVALKDYASSFASYNLTIDRNGSKLDSAESNKALNTDNLSMTLVYVDSTQGWKPVEEGTGFIGEAYITATGGTITTSGDCKIHKFTGPGTFTVCSVASSAANNLVSYVVVAGGAGGGWDRGGGGGAGGFRETKSPVTPYTASPLDGYATPGNRITVTATSFPIVVGSGGTAGSPGLPTAKGGTGGVSSFSTITSAGGGGGGAANPSAPTGPGADGGSGGGAANRSPTALAGGCGNTPPTTPAQGTNGGPTVPPSVTPGGGGGGATAAGATATNGVGNGVPGGAGATTHITGSPVAYAGGGGGGASFCCGNTCRTGGPGGTGGGGQGGNSPGGDAGCAGTVNTGGGGGGGGNPSPSGPSLGGTGGSGIVIIRYKYQ